MIHFAMFAKYWEVGRVKTRLARLVGAEAASEVYQIFLRHLVQRFSDFGDTRTVVYSPVDARDKFRELLPDNWQVQPQSEGELGERMELFFRENFEGPESVSILIGSDTPDLPVVFVEDTVDLLRKASVVLGPSADGGYYLIAIKGEVVDIFDGIPWSTDQVLPLTIKKLEELDISFSLLPELKDVDEFEDLQLLIDKLTNLDRDPLDERLLNELINLELPHE